MGIIKFILYQIYFSLSATLFRYKSGTVSIGIKVKHYIYRKINFEGNNKVGRNSKIIIPNKSNIKQFYLGKNSWLRDNVEINAPGSSIITIKRQVSVQDNCKILGDVTIESNCILAPDVFISSGTHSPFYSPNLIIREQDNLVLKKHGFISKHVHIEEDCWIGKSVFIEPGVYIGKGCIIGTGARIKKNIPPYSVVINDSIILKNRIEFNPPSKINVSKEFIPYYYRGFETSINNLNKGYFPLSEKKGIIILQKSAISKKIHIIGVNLNKHPITIAVEPSSNKPIRIESGDFELNFELDERNNDILNTIFDYLILSLHCDNYEYLAIKSVSSGK